MSICCESVLQVNTVERIVLLLHLISYLCNNVRNWGILCLPYSYNGEKKREDVLHIYSGENGDHGNNHPDMKESWNSQTGIKYLDLLIYFQDCSDRGVTHKLYESAACVLLAFPFRCYSVVGWHPCSAHRTRPVTQVGSNSSNTIERSLCNWK